MSNIENWKIQKLLQKCSNLGIPHFQRGYVWSDSNISALLESLYFDTPCGNLVLWKNPDSEHLGSYGIPLISNNPDVEYFLIDGQQRTRSLYSVFSHELVGETEVQTDAPEPKREETDNRYVWAVNIAQFEGGEKLFRKTPLQQSLFVKIREPFQEKKAYNSYVRDKKEKWAKEQTNHDKIRLQFRPQYKCQYNFVPLSFFIS